AAIERIASLASRVPGGHVTGNPGWAFAGPWALLLMVVLWIRRDRPTAHVMHHRALWTGATLAWGVLVWVMPVGANDSGELAIHVLDVGQGDGIAIRTPGGHWILVDAGPRTPERDAGRDVVVPFLKAQGVRQLDLALTTHTDADHLGGMPYVLRAMHPSLVLDNGQPVGTALFLDYQHTLTETGVPWHVARTGDSLTIDSVSLLVLSPSDAWEQTHLETNGNSVVVRLRYRNFTALLTGDMDSLTEAAVLARAEHADLLKVAHHGSSTSTSTAWLSRVTPTAAVISVGAHNRYGHPAPETLLRLAVRGIPYWRTDQGGAVTIRSDGRYFAIDQRRPHSWSENLWCLLLKGLPSSVSSPTRSACTSEAPPVSFPASSPTSPAPPRP
ncbi:MAG TPA: ComEC/Rec2 family competence protein, partial [Gemmatimonadales bacterium]